MALPESADPIIQKIINWADAHDSIHAVLLTSNRAIPGARLDALSDYDIILVVEDIHPFVNDPSWLEEFGKVLVAYWDNIHVDQDFGIEISSNVIQYYDGLKTDFNLWPVKLVQRIVAARNLPAELDAG